jgi:hypothetical protein
MRIAFLAFSLATSLFAWVTMRTAVDVIDGPILQHYGFPLPYRRWSQFSSLHYDLDWVAMTFDYLVYLFVCSLPLALRRIRTRAAAMPNAVVALLCAGALLSLLLSFAAGLAGALHPARFDENLRVIERRLYVGVGFPY